jgi:hypothetical protein
MDEAINRRLSRMIFKSLRVAITKTRTGLPGITNENSGACFRRDRCAVMVVYVSGQHDVCHSTIGSPAETFLSRSRRHLSLQCSA